MRRLLLRVLLPFAVALPAGFVVGGMSGGKEEPTAPSRPTRVAERGPAPAMRSGVSGLDELLQRYQADEQAREESDADPFIDWVAGWTEDELATALTEALRLPRCMDPLGRDHRLLFRLHRAWMQRNPEEATAWIESVPSTVVRDEMVRNACQSWPADRAMEGIDFMLANHWQAGRNYSHTLVENALESQAVLGSAAVDQLLQRLAAAKVGVSVDSLDLPAGFDFAAVVEGEGVAALQEPSFKNQLLVEWRSQDPGSMLGWMDRSENWETFHDFVAEGRPETVRFWNTADAEAREAALEKIRWRELDRGALDRFIGQVDDAEGKEALVTGYFRSGASDDPVAVLGLIPSAQTRMNVLASRYPDIDWRADATSAPGEPAWAPAMRGALVEWKVTIPAPPPDPFASP